MGVTKKSRGERAQQKREEAAREEQQGKLECCLKACQLHYEVIDSVWAVIQTFGHTEASLAKEPDPEPRTKAGKQRREKKEQRKAIIAASTDPDDVIDVERYPTLGSFKQLFYRKELLPMIDGSSFSAANLYANEAKIGGKSGYLELLEYATGLPPDYPLSELGSKKALIAFLQEQVALRPGRTLGFSLPQKWGADGGLYKLMEGPVGTVVLQHKWTGKNYAVDPGQLPSHKAFSELQIEKNFSEERAAIVSMTCPDPNSRYLCTRVCTEHTVSSMFGDDAGSTPNTKRRKLALKNVASQQKERKPLAGAAKKVLALPAPAAAETEIVDDDDSSDVEEVGGGEGAGEGLGAAARALMDESELTIPDGEGS